MNFKIYYNLTKNETTKFESVFEYYYNRGFFGSIDKNDIKHQQLIWCSKIKKFIKDKNTDELIRALANRENVLSREFFNIITGYNIKYETKQKLTNFIHEFINKTKNELKNLIIK